jgi:hypothetical protein
VTFLVSFCILIRLKHELQGGNIKDLISEIQLTLRHVSPEIHSGGEYFNSLVCFRICAGK